MAQRHDAFISYSHRADGRLAPAVESALETLARPMFKLRALDVFRDETSLAASPALWPGIVQHLEASRWFLFFACPESAASEWCRQEVAWWLDHHGTERLLVVLTGGEIAWSRAQRDFDWAATTAIAPALAGRWSDEPLYADLRWAREGPVPTLDHARFRNVIVGLAAPLHGMPREDLDSEDVRRLRRSRWLLRGGISAISLAAALAAWQAVVAVQQRDRAEAERVRAEGERARAEGERARAEAALAATQRELLRAQIAELGSVRRRVETLRAADRDAELAALDRRQGLLVDQLQVLLARQIGFRGDLRFLMRWEGEVRRAALLPGGEVMLPPATSLPFVKPEVVQRRYATLLSPHELDAVVALAGQKRDDARVAPYREVLQRIELAPSDVARLVPEVVEDFWKPLLAKAPQLADPGVPAAVHTALLSMSFNVGAGRALRTAQLALEQRDWGALADAIEQEGQRMPMPQLQRRRAAEAALIRDAISRR